ncbi:MAG TPA: hypothetical protein PL002_11280, partial [Flavobacteriales bacterium]|nr:hypothetical protein [Flavobacteriales bacterium]
SIYTENLTIDKSVEILSMVPGRRYTATGNLLIAPPVQTVKRIVVHDLELLGNISTGGQVNHPNIIVLTGCRTGRIDFGLNFSWRIALANDSILGRLFLPGGTLVGSYVRGDTLGGGGFKVLTSTGSNRPLVLIGNILGDPYEADKPIGSCAIDLFSADTIRFENNHVRLYREHYVSEPICLNSAYNTSASAVRLLNNTFIRSATAGSVGPIIADQTIGYVESRNNFFLGPITAPIFSHPYTDEWNLFSTDQEQVDPATGRPIAGSICTDVGDPDGRYNDLDLSRNDAGCYGGSFSRDLFDDPPTGTAEILWSHVVRRVFSSVPVGIDASCTDQ